MHDAGIDEGDLVVITAQNEANVGDIVVALDGSGQNTLKRYPALTRRAAAMCWNI